MFSFATSSTSSPPVVIDQANLIALKKAMIAMPAGLSTSNNVSMRKRKGKKGSRNDGYVAIVYDPVAGRPIPMGRVPIEQKITVALRYSIIGAFTANLVTPTFYSLSFIVNNFDDASSYLSVFDQYKFEQVEVWNGVSSPNINPPAAGNEGLFYSAVDLDDANAPTTITNVEAKQGSIVSNPQGGHYHKWKPHVAIAAYSGAFTSFSNSPAVWIDSASPSVQHYGYKAAVSLSSIAQSYNMTIRAIISFRSAGL